MMDIGHWCRTAFVAAKKESEYKKLTGFLASDDPYKRVLGTFQSGKTALIQRAALSKHPNLQDHEPTAGESWPSESELSARMGNVLLFSVSATYRENKPRDKYVTKEEFTRELLRSFASDDDGERSRVNLGTVLYSIRESGRTPIIHIQGGFKDYDFEDMVFDAIEESLRLKQRNQAIASMWHGSQQDQELPRIGEQQLNQFAKIVFEYWPYKKVGSNDRHRGLNGHSEKQEVISLDPKPMSKPREEILRAASSEITVQAIEASNRDIMLASTKAEALTVLVGALRQILPSELSLDVIDSISEKVYEHTGGHLGCITLVLLAIKDKVEEGGAPATFWQETGELANSIKRYIWEAEDRTDPPFSAVVKNILFSLGHPREEAIKEENLDEQWHGRLQEQGLITSTTSHGRPNWIELIKTLLPSEPAAPPVTALQPGIGNNLLISELGDILSRGFDPSGLQTFALALDLNPNNLAGVTHLSRSQDLVATLSRQDRLSYLATIGPLHNAGIQWADLLSRHGIPVPPPPP